MSRELLCKACGKNMGTVRDGRLRNGMAVYCDACDIKRDQAVADSKRRAEMDWIKEKLLTGFRK